MKEMLHFFKLHQLLWFTLFLLGSPIIMSSKLAVQQNSILSRKIPRVRRPNSGGNSATAICKSLPTPTRDQLELCSRYPDVTASAMQGLRIAVHECQHQFRKHRWNCSALESSKNRNLHSSVIMSRGYRESAFMHALAAAGVAHAVARACSLGKLMSCGCGNSPLAKSDTWRWSGCNHNIDFGVTFSKMLLDSREKAKDIQSKINTHNNQAGRNVIARNTEIKCKCHGMSGSCELKTCWKAAVGFRRVGAILKERFRNSVLVDDTNSGAYGTALRLAPSGGAAGNYDSSSNNNAASQKMTRRQPSPPPVSANQLQQRRPGQNGVRRPQQDRRQRRKGGGRRLKPADTDLVYFERSPNFCERDPATESAGTRGRLCNKTSVDNDHCDSLCCGRGYNTLRQRRVERCQCRFRWCCHVVCQECVYEEWVTECK